MPFDFVADTSPARRLRGQRAYLSGLAAEQGVERHYARRGQHVLARRWRGLSGEIDLVLDGPEGLIFVEVKCGPTHDMAAERLGPAQRQRICLAVEEYVDQVLGQPFAERQYHLATVDGTGQVAIRDDYFLP
jgi:putative endonuclease